MSSTLFAQRAWLSQEQTWQDNVRFHWDEQGTLTQVETQATANAFEKQVGFVLPGMINLHSHSFQRAMAGMTEIAGDTPDSFWTWRDLMYRYALAISPEQIQAIAAQLYSEGLRHGYTSVCEFHYVHRDPQGAMYSDSALMAKRVIAAAQETGMGMSMLPVLYSYADFGEKELRHDQRRFRTDVNDILTMIESLDSLRSKQIEIGVAPHSLRAASIAQIQELQAALPKQRPIHIHIAEQQKEVEACLAYSGKRPVQLLLDEVALDQRWCLVHATHLTPDEVSRIAQSQAVAGICTSTEGNLGDGFFELPSFIAQQGRFGIGTDSHASQGMVEELRWLEYGQRLRHQARNVATTSKQKRVADFLWQECLQGGTAAAAREVGSLVVGKQADMLVLDEAHPNLQDLASQDILNTWIFAGNDNLIRDVYVAGKQVVQQGRHIEQEKIQSEYIACMKQLRSLG